MSNTWDNRWAEQQAENAYNRQGGRLKAIGARRNKNFGSNNVWKTLIGVNNMKSSEGWPPKLERNERQ